jgi:serine/threonine-protein kinase
LSTSTEIRIPTQTFLLPGQKFCIGLPWERADLPARGMPAPAPKLALAKLTLRDGKEVADPFAGWELGNCRVLHRLSEGSARTLLAVRTDETDGPQLVVMRRLELPEVLGREARNHAEWAARYSHPNLARVYDCEIGDEGVFWVTQLSSGATLAEVAELMRRQGQGVPLGLTLGVVLEAARALSELHLAGAAHGLIRDQSLAVTLDGTARLLDTGLFRCLGQGPSWLEVREVMGPYFAPEQLLEGRLPDPKTDVYSLGVVLYEGITGEQVRRGKTFEQQVKLVQSGKLVPPSRLNVAVGPALDEVLQRALAPERSKRYANAREFALALNEAASAFMWRPKLRAQFIGRHFDERRRQDESLRAMITALPPRKVTPPAAPARSRTLAEAAIPAMTMNPLTVSVHHASARPVPRPSAPRKPVVPPASKTLAPLVGLLAALLGFLASTELVPALHPAPPRPPPVAVIRLAPIVIAEAEVLDQQVERVMAEAPLAFTPELASIEPPVIEATAPVAAPVRKVKRIARRDRDEAPVPPWLVKRSRR